jgi:hypothetical protein
MTNIKNIDITKTFLGKLTPEQLDVKLAEAYLGIITNDETIFNPLANIPPFINDKFSEYVCHLMSDPDYFYFLMRYILQIDTWPQQALMIKEMYTHRFPMLIGSRGLGKSYMLAVYMMLRMLIIPGTQCIITSAGFRQAKVVFEYMERIWKKSIMLQNCFKGGNNGPTHGTDVWTFRLGDSITYAIPVGHDGSKVRGYRANCVHEDTLINTNKGLVKIKDFKSYECESVVNMNGDLEFPKSFYNTEPTEVYEIITENGFSLKFSKIHRIKTLDGWRDGHTFNVGEEIIIDMNEYFPEDYINFNGIILDDGEIFSEAFVKNASFFISKELPWYILQSPRSIIYKFLKMIFKGILVNTSCTCNTIEKARQIQILLLKFRIASSISQAGPKSFIVTSTKQIKVNDIYTEKIASIKLLDEKSTLYDFELEDTNSFIGNGFVNHNCLVADEFATLPRQIFEEVMGGFLSVAPSPVEQIKLNAKIDAFKKLNVMIPKSNSSINFLQNQLILSGTAYYKINHFWQYYNKWKDIILSKNNPKLIKSLFENEEDYKEINPDDYSVIRMPIELTVNGYMDMAQISRIKASTTKDVYVREYGACFSDDSEGFFRKSLIDSCTCIENDSSIFVPALYGDQNKKYVMGVDPAYEGDNFAIVILELNGKEKRVVHCWTTQSSDHKQRLRDGITKENQYFHFCARKIRSLLKHFPCEYIAIDPLGGGRAVIEALMDPNTLQSGEVLILESIEQESGPKETDLMSGLHILKIINFTSEWISKANYLMKKDMEDKFLKFPFSDDISYAIAEYYDDSLGNNKSLYDTLDDCIYEIEELKKELTSITVTESATGKEKFDTPSIKINANRKGRLRKDRYSALLMANWIARNISENEDRLENPDIVMLTGFSQLNQSGRLFKGNTKIATKLSQLYRKI